MCKAIVLGVDIVAHVLESEIENGRMNIYRGIARNLAMGGQKILDRKPHPLINAETVSNYYSVRVPAKNTYFVKQ